MVFETDCGIFYNFKGKNESSNRITREESKEERTEDALASGGEEGRGKLRKGAGNCKQVMIRACPNGATHLAEGQVPRKAGRTRGTETS